MQTWIEREADAAYREQILDVDDTGAFGGGEGRTAADVEATADAMLTAILAPLGAAIGMLRLMRRMERMSLKRIRDAMRSEQ